MDTLETFHIRDLDAEVLKRERSRVLSLVQNYVPSEFVMEVGSTAVPGVIGKQDIDVVVRVPSDSFLSVREILDHTFARNSQQLSNDEYQGYVVPSDLDASIQLIVKDGPFDTFETFLQALTANPALLRAYNDLKTSWNGRPMREYRLAKQGFINSVLAEKPFVQKLTSSQRGYDHV